MDSKLFLLIFCLAVSYLRMAACSKEGEFRSIYQADHEVSPPARTQTAVDGDGYSIKRLGSDHTLNALLNSIIHVPEKAGRNPSFVFEPQRFGRAAQRSLDSGTEPQIHYRDWEIIPSQIWSMTMPQRFGKKK